ncbi:Hint domain-containing protein [Gemmobacter denitrificans]|uniref:Hint domain-containing protein n=1 Tax=Gemmobacter denitrificans TaxID=3123040 RepID=A0ABU8BXD8_9RHOB
MAGWLALSDQGAPPAAQRPGETLRRGTLVFEITTPLQQAGVLIDWVAGAGTGQRSLALFHDHDSGLILLQRQGALLMRHVLPGPLPEVPGLARILFHWDQDANSWDMRYRRSDLDLELRAGGTGVLSPRLGDLVVLCQNGMTGDQALAERSATRHPALLWFGVTDGAAPPQSAPWIGPRTQIQTPTGFRLAAQLRPGDMVLTEDRGACMLQSVRRLDLPGRGRHAPVLLRAPYFSPARDVLVSADQALVQRGSDVEYLFFEDAVLVQAGFLTDGRAALLDTRRAVMATVSLDIGRPGLILGEGLSFLSAQHGPGAEMPPPMRQLHRYEAVPLMAVLGHGAGRSAA